MEPLSAQQVRMFLNQEVIWADNELKRLAEARSEHAALLQKTRLNLEEAWQSLLATLVPSIDPQDLTTAGLRVHLPALASDSHNLRERRRAELATVLARCADDPDLRKRDALGLELSMALPPLAETIKSLSDSVEPVRSEPSWAELLASDYGTEQYAVPFWNLTYYRLWKQADEIVERHGANVGANNFSDLRRKWLQEAQALGTLLENQKELQDRQSRLLALQREESDAAGALQALDVWSLAAARGLVRAQLEDLAEADFIDLMCDVPALKVGAKRVSAVAAKCRYLEAIGREWLWMPEQDLIARVKKLKHNMSKFARPKYAGQAFQEDEVHARYGLDRNRWNTRWNRYHATTRSIVVFQDYDAYDPLRDVIWWDVMTGGQTKARFIPEVNEAYESRRHHHAHDAVTEEHEARDNVVLYADAS